MTERERRCQWHHMRRILLGMIQDAEILEREAAEGLPSPRLAEELEGCGRKLEALGRRLKRLAARCAE